VAEEQDPVIQCRKIAGMRAGRKIPGAGGRKRRWQKETSEAGTCGSRQDLHLLQKDACTQRAEQRPSARADMQNAAGSGR